MKVQASTLMRWNRGPKTALAYTVTVFKCGGHSVWMLFFSMQQGYDTYSRSRNMRYTFIGRNRKWNGWKSIEMVPMVPPTGWLQSNLKYFKDGECFQTKWQMGQMQVRKQLVESTPELLKWHIKHTDRTSCSPCVLSNANSNPPQYNTTQCLLVYWFVWCWH